jgi:multicomponent K+:H+ antiporter subunit E
MARWFAHPVLSVLIGIVWLLLQGSLEPVHWIVAAVLGLVIPRLVAGFLPVTTRLRAGRTALRLAGAVLWDILVANVTVARLVLDPRSTPQPAWVRVPLDLEHPTAIVLLATIITTTPGTVSCVIDEARREILVHALDGRGAEGMPAQIKARYEAPLKEIFE